MIKRHIFDKPGDPEQTQKLLACLDLCKGVPLALDLETFDPDGGLTKNKKGLCPHLGKIRLWQLHPEGGDTYVIQDPARGAEADYPLFSITCNHWMDNPEVFEKVKYLVEDEKTVKILHNSMFDSAWLKIKHGMVLDNVWDTMIASQVTYAGSSVRHGLGPVTQRYLNKKIDKTQQKSDWGSHKLHQSQVEYACIDVENLHALKQAQIDKASGVDILPDIYFEMSCIPLFIELTTVGFYADPDDIETFRADYATQIESYGKQIVDILQPHTDKLIKPTTPAGILVPLICKEYGLKERLFSTESTACSLSKEVLTGLVSEEHPIFELFLRYRTLVSVSNYSRAIDAGFFPVNGQRRVTGTFRVLASNAVGRSSSGQWFTKCGINFQNPNKPLDKSGSIQKQLKSDHELKDLKELLKAPPGKKLLIFDFAAAHARIAADLALDRTLLDVYANDLDSHCLMIAQLAEQMDFKRFSTDLGLDFDWSFKSITEVRSDKKHPLYPLIDLIRDRVAKVTFYLGLNGGGKGRAYSQINARGFSVSEEGAGIVIDAWRSVYKGLWKFMQDAQQKAKVSRRYDIDGDKYKQYWVPRLNSLRWLPLYDSDYSDEPEPKLNDVTATNWLMIEGKALKLAAKEALRIMQTNLMWHAKLLVLCHDEMVWEIDEKYAYSGSLAGQHCMRTGLQVWLDLVEAVPVTDPQANIADNWSEK